jgi:hypothetical protein
MASVHTSHGIMLQDFSCPADQEVEELSKSEWNMNGTFGFLTIWGDNKVDVVSTAMAIEVSSSRENEYVSE